MEVQQAIEQADRSISAAEDGLSRLQVELGQLQDALAGIEAQRNAYQLQLAKKRNLISRARQMGNALVARRYADMMDQAMGSSFEAGVSDGFSGMRNQVLSAISEVEDEIRAKQSQINALQDEKARQVAALSAEAARQVGGVQ